MTTEPSLRRDRTVVGAALTAAGTVLAGIATALAAFFGGSSHATPTPAPSCVTVVEQYHVRLLEDPGMLGALESIVATEPDARRCGITATTLADMAGR